MVISDLKSLTGGSLELNCGHACERSADPKTKKWLLPQYLNLNASLLQESRRETG